MKLKHLIIKAFRGKRAYYKEKLALAETAMRKMEDLYMCDALSRQGLNAVDKKMIGFSRQDFHNFIRSKMPLMCPYMDVTTPMWLGPMESWDTIVFKSKVNTKAEYLKYLAERL